MDRQQSYAASTETDNDESEQAAAMTVFNMQTDRAGIVGPMHKLRGLGVTIQ